MGDVAGALLLVGRIVFALFFVFAGVNHITNGKQMTDYVRQVGFPVPALAPWPAGVWLVAGGVSIAAGIFAEVGALMLIVFLVPAACWFHAFWKVPEDAKQTEMMSFLRDVTFVGACLVLFAVFAWLDDGLRFAVTGALIELD